MPTVIDWLLKGDPSIRWQAQRDLLHLDPDIYERERLRIRRAGWGRQLLSKQDADGNWGGGIYTPKWTSTTYTLLLLRDMGLSNDNPQAQRACENFFFRGLEHDGGINLFKSLDYSELCVNGMLLSLLSYFRSSDPRLHHVADFVLGQQMRDGGWNCRIVRGATHGSFNTTISVLEGLREYANRNGITAQLTEAVARAHEFLLRHQLFRSHRTGRIVDSEMTRLHFPPRWHYDILRSLDYFRSVGAAPDPRMADAIALLKTRRGEDGRWSLNKPWTGRVFFDLELLGEPSRWNTLRALRVLQWWQCGTA
jgi:hypothetical protein